MFCPYSVQEFWERDRDSRVCPDPLSDDRKARERERERGARRERGREGPSQLSNNHVLILE